MEIIINYHSYQGGINNMQTATIRNTKGVVLKVFSSQHNRAKEYADRWIKKETLSKRLNHEK